RELPEANARARSAVASGLGQLRYDVSPGLLPAGARGVPRDAAPAQGRQPAVRPLHYGAVPIQLDGRPRDVPVFGAPFVTKALHIAAIKRVTTRCSGSMGFHIDNPPTA